MSGEAGSAADDGGAEGGDAAGWGARGAVVGGMVLLMGWCC